MRIGSVALYKFLKAKGVLNASEETIAQAKAEYRRNYKRDWKKRQILKKELRIFFTLKQHHQLVFVAKSAGFKAVTAYSKEVLLAASNQQQCLIPNKDRLFEVLQNISIAINKGAVFRDEELRKAEQILLDYLQLKQPSL